MTGLKYTQTLPVRHSWGAFIASGLMGLAGSIFFLET